MIDVMQNKILGPMMVRQYQQGQFDLPRKLLAVKFSALPLWAEKRLLTATSLEDVLTS